MPLIKPTAPNNIVASLDQDIDEFFGLDRLGLSHRNKEACVRLCKEQPSKDGAELIGLLRRRIAQNRSSLTEAGRAARGSRTWRWKKNVDLSQENTSIETRIERAITRLLDDNWVNQVPVASGLTDASEGRCDVDIIRRHSRVEFDFIELKALRPGQKSIGHHTPLAAAMELLKYGLIFVYCKENRSILYPDVTVARPVLDAEIVHLEVLGTPNCFRRTERTGSFNIAWLNQLIVSGLKELARTSTASVSLDFAFTQFPESFVWTDSDHDQLLTCEPNSDCWFTLQRKIKTAVTSREPVALKT